ncbi:hypothetical protein [Dryocola sp. BD626]|jgi:hypothetical protein|uniref:hypothetical protein n=1 Tax=Dryocola sp. BD626 TaxID=3133273 RepID=UPI003F4FCCC5
MAILPTLNAFQPRGKNTHNKNLIVIERLAYIGWLRFQALFNYVEDLLFGVQ